MTASTKDEFSDWMEATLEESKDIIDDFNPAITYDVDGNVANMKAKDLALKLEVGKVAPLKAAAIKQVKVVNTKRDEKYRTASAVADGVSGHLGKNHPLSILIHQKRESLSNIANRGPHTPATETPLITPTV